MWIACLSTVYKTTGIYKYIRRRSGSGGEMEPFDSLMHDRTESVRKESHSKNQFIPRNIDNVYAVVPSIHIEEYSCANTSRGIQTRTALPHTPSSTIRPSGELLEETVRTELLLLYFQKVLEADVETMHTFGNAFLHNIATKVEGDAMQGLLRRHGITEGSQAAAQHVLAHARYKGHEYCEYLAQGYLDRVISQSSKQRTNEIRV